MKLSHIEFPTADGLNLPGLMYEPEIKTEAVAIFLHGNGSSSIFYSPTKGATYAEYLNEKKIAYFSFNNRGAHIVKKLDKKVGEETVRTSYGCAFELIKECIFDIDGAIDHLAKLGYKTFYLIGSSTGANKICVYNYYKQDNRVAKYVLLSGGDDSGNYYQMMGKEKFDEVLMVSREKTEAGKGIELAPTEMMGIYSYQSIFDILNPDGDYNIFPYFEVLNKLKLSTKELFGEFKAIDKPTLVIYGEKDEYCYGRVPEIIELLKINSKKPDQMTFKMIANADHGFSEHKEEMVKLIANWL